MGAKRRKESGGNTRASIGWDDPVAPSRAAVCDLNLPPPTPPLHSLISVNLQITTACLQDSEAKLFGSMIASHRHPFSLGIALSLFRHLTLTFSICDTRILSRRKYSTPRKIFNN